MSCGDWTCTPALNSLWHVVKTSRSTCGMLPPTNLCGTRPLRFYSYTNKYIHWITAIFPVHLCCRVDLYLLGRRTTTVFVMHVYLYEKTWFLLDHYHVLSLHKVYCLCCCSLLYLSYLCCWCPLTSRILVVLLAFTLAALCLLWAPWLEGMTAHEGFIMQPKQAQSEVFLKKIK